VVRDQPGDRADVDDRARLVLRQIFDAVLGAEEHAVDVDAHQAAKAVKRQFFDAAFAR
jgi:hypothetical protein